MKTQLLSTITLKLIIEHCQIGITVLKFSSNATQQDNSRVPNLKPKCYFLRTQ